jgi:uncharacterized membrane protein YhaH (DUF805 family)
MKRSFQVLLTFVLGGAAALFHVTLWRAWRAGTPHGEPIMGLMGKHGVTAADPLAAFFGLTMLLSLAFLVSAITLFPRLTGRARRWRDARWPPSAEKAPGPPWICANCHEENPGNFGECWKCQRVRPPQIRS